MAAPDSALQVLITAGRLKRALRTGWVNHGVVDPECIAAHMYRMAIAAFLAKDVDSNRALRMAVVHDLGESIVGDITPHDGVSDKDKHALELAAYQELAKMIGDHPAAGEIMELWQEYEECKTPVAKFVKDIDKFDMVLQAYEYEREQAVDLEQFFTGVRGRLQTPQVQGWMAALEAHRNNKDTTLKMGTAPVHAKRAARLHHSARVGFAAGVVVTLAVVAAASWLRR